MSIELVTSENLKNYINNNELECDSKRISLDKNLQLPVDLKKVHLIDCAIVYLPNRIFDFCQNLEEINLSFNQITNLDESLFKNCLELAEVNFENNQIEIIPNKIFHNVKHISKIIFSNNNIKSISPEVFQNNSTLEELLFDGNQIETIQIGIFDGCPNLQILDFSNNKLVSFSLNIFPNSLTELIIEKNQISSLPVGIFDNLINLQTINLGYNKLKSLDENVFVHCTNLINIALNNNLLESLPSGILSKQTSLSMLFLSNNKIKYLPGNLLQKNVFLNIIHMDNNQIIELDENFFQNCSNISEIKIFDNNLKNLYTNFFPSNILTELNLEHNQIVSLPIGIFDNCINLITLNISSNKLISLDKNLFKKCKSIAHIFLNNNQLESVHRRIFSQLNLLLTISLSNNKLKYVPYDLLHKNIELVEFYINNNEIEEFDEDFYSNCEKIYALDFSYNKLTAIPKRLFHKLSRLVSINGRNNEIETLHPENFNFDNSLKFLDFRFNKIKHLSLNIFDYLSPTCLIDFQNNIDNENIGFLFHYIFEFIKLSSIRQYKTYIQKYQHTIGLTYKTNLSYNHVTDFERVKNKFYLVRINDEKMLKEILFMIYLSKSNFNYKSVVCSDIIDSETSLTKQEFENKLEDLENFDISVLDFLISLPFVTNESIMSLKNEFIKYSKNNPATINLEFKLFSSKVITFFYMRNDLELVETFFSSDKIKLFLKNHDQTVIAGIKRFIYFDKQERFIEFFEKIEFSKCFEIVLKNKNEDLAIHLLLVFIFIKVYSNSNERREFEKDFLNKKFLLAIFKENWFKLIEFILDYSFILKDVDDEIICLYEKETSITYFDECNKIIKTNKITESSDQNIKQETFTDDKNLKNNKIGHDIYSLDYDKDMLTMINLLHYNKFLLHTTVKKILDKRWESVPRLFYYFNLILYLIFILFFSIYLELFKYMDRNESLITASLVISTVIGIYFYIIELIELIDSFVTRNIIIYITTLRNVLELTHLPILFVSLFLPEKSSFDLKSSFLACSIFQSYIVLLIKMNKFWLIGSYVNVFGNVIKRSLRLIIILFICMIGFLLAFRTRTVNYQGQIADENLVVYLNSSFELSLYRLMIMTIGNVGTDDMGIDRINDNLINFFVYLLFIFLMPILFLNIFTGISIDEIKNLIENCDAENISNKIEYTKKFDKIVKHKYDLGQKEKTY
ncbi:unnamed protein product [Brachionus calyciflorus]|uniref:Uncharacterized protein n=1 Tax=Brachionus calyciflorus TaxID=104777 RepID=A0A813XZS4_9BILA|nr:unnamed protein product [Brachionus calyciflorus]